MKKRAKEDPASMLSNPFKLLKKVKKGKEAGKAGKVANALSAESELGPVLHKEAASALRRMESADPSLKKLLQRSYGYAIFPRVGKASAVLGGAFGLGEVREHEQVAGYAAMIQATVGLQVGKQTYQELVVFSSPEALEEFKRGKISFAANTSAVLVKAGAAATAGQRGTKIFVRPRTGFGGGADIGGQKFIYKPAVLGRVRSAFEPAKTALKKNLQHFGKSTNPNVIPGGGPQVPVGRSARRGTAARHHSQHR